MDLYAYEKLMDRIEEIQEDLNLIKDKLGLNEEDSDDLEQLSEDNEDINSLDI